MPYCFWKSIQWRQRAFENLKWPFVIRFGLKICFCSLQGIGRFRGVILTVWLSLVKLHEKKRRTIPKILPWKLKFLSVYKLVVVNTSNGFFLHWISSKTWYFAIKKSLFFIQIPTKLHFKYLFCYDQNSHVIRVSPSALPQKRTSNKQVSSLLV